jgi:hypothetical protein
MYAFSANSAIDKPALIITCIHQASLIRPIVDTLYTCDCCFSGKIQKIKTGSIKETLSER